MTGPVACDDSSYHAPRSAEALDAISGHGILTCGHLNKNDSASRSGDHLSSAARLGEPLGAKGSCLVALENS